MDSWSKIDVWCLSKSINGDPWKIPSFRFSNIVEAVLLEGLSEEQQGQVDDALTESDLVPHPFHKASVTKLPLIRGTRPIEDVTSSEPPIEEIKRREAAEQGKPYYVPPWWRGEKANYKVAQVMMKQVPRNIGPLNQQ